MVTCNGTRLLHFEQEDQDGSQVHEICHKTEQVHYEDDWGGEKDWVCGAVLLRLDGDEQ